MANIAYQYRLYPDLEQAALFVRTFGCCRKVWNLMLSDKIEYLVRVEKHFPASYAAAADTKTRSQRIFPSGRSAARNYRSTKCIRGKLD